MEDDKRFIAALMTAVSQSALYSRGHSSLTGHADKMLSLMEGVFEAGGNYEVMFIGDDIIINGNPVKRAGYHGVSLIRTLRRKGVSRIDFLKGISNAEILSFIEDLSGRGSSLGSYPHIRSGVVDVMLGMPYTADSSPVAMNEGSFGLEQVEQVRELYYNIPRFKRLNVVGLEEIVLQFISAFRRESNILRLLNPMRSYSEYTYTHATNVAILSMLQAERLGLEGEMLRSLGIAALVHDVGKLFISNDILEKNGALDAQEWEEMQRHTIYGAKYLVKIDKLSPIAPVIALEHHSRFDGSGYPKSALQKKQLLLSQIVAVSDTFDALRSKRPYKKDWEAEEALALLKKCAGKDFNPFLVDHFIKIIRDALKEEGCEA